uniref:Uncharacterized protein n=1 Tax=Arundo donax TaxID=35708 RepID=A0A0A9DS98_ARUDO
MRTLQKRRGCCFKAFLVMNLMTVNVQRWVVSLQCPEVRYTTSPVSFMICLN